MSLIEQLRGADMLVIDELHAWQFELNEQAADDELQLKVECMDGRTRRVWQFTAGAVAAATQGDDSGWRINDGEGAHVLVCLGAIRADNDDDNDCDDGAEPEA